MKKIMLFIISILFVISMIPTNITLAEELSVKVDGLKWSWMGIMDGPGDYNRRTKATNEIGDTKTANEIGIDYCELLETATYTKPGAFKVSYKLPDGTTSSNIYIIPKKEMIERGSYIYFREEGSQLSLLPNRELYIQNIYTLYVGNCVSLSWEAKEFKGYEFTRSVISTKSNTGFSEELKGEAGKIRSGNLTYNNSNDFNIIFYYKPITTLEISSDKDTYIKTKHINLRGCRL